MESNAWLGVVVAALDQLAARLYSGIAARGIDASAVADVHHLGARDRPAGGPDRARNRPARDPGRPAARRPTKRPPREPDRADRRRAADRRRELRGRQGVPDRVDRWQPSARPWTL